MNPLLKSSLTFMFVLLLVSSAPAGGLWWVKIPETQSSTVPLLNFMKELSAGFENYDEARMPLAQRVAWGNRMVKACKAGRPAAGEQAEFFGQACYGCSVCLSSFDLGKDRLEKVQTLVALYLPYVDAVPVSLAKDMVCQMSYNLDLDCKPLTNQSAPAYRNLFVEYRLRVWRRLVAEVDPTWKQDDPANQIPHIEAPGSHMPGSVDLLALKDPKVRSAYENAIAERDRRAERNNQQFDARRNVEDWRKHELLDFVTLYERYPVSKDDWEMLKAYLRIYVADGALRKELFDKCQAAATKHEAK